MALIGIVPQSVYRLALEYEFQELGKRSKTVSERRNAATTERLKTGHCR